MYNYNRTAADDDTNKALAWLSKHRRKIIKQHLDAMGKSLESLTEDAKKQFPGMNEADVMRELRRMEIDLRDSLKG